MTVGLNQTADRSVTVPLTTEPASGPFRLDGAPDGRVVFALRHGLADVLAGRRPGRRRRRRDGDARVRDPARRGHARRAGLAGRRHRGRRGRARARRSARRRPSRTANCRARPAARPPPARARRATTARARTRAPTGRGRRRRTPARPSGAARRSAPTATCDARADDDDGSCDVGSYADAADTAEEWKWTCGGTACSTAKPAAPACAAAEGSCTPGTAVAAADTLDPATERWSCSNGGETADCSAAADACGTNETHALDGQGELECRCEAGHHRHNGACTADPACNDSPTDPADACTTGTYGATPADTYRDGACGTAANSCDAGTADESPADAAAVHGACGTAVDGCADGTLEAVDDTDEEHRWNCLGDDGATNWSCSGTAGDWNWSCAAGAQTLDSCTAPKTGTTATGCTSAVDANDAACSLCKTGHERCGGSCVAQCGANEVRNADTCACDCDAGHHRHDGACVVDPECGGTADACVEGTAGTVADTLDPPTARWSCASGAETLACTAAFACGTNEVAELDGSDELQCACSDGHHSHNGACTADPACSASPTNAADACTTGTYGEAPADTYEDGACGTAANSCDAGTADESPPDAVAEDGACGTALDGCSGGTHEDVDDTDAEHRWNCLGEAGATNWSCAGTAGDWNWSCTAGAQTLDSCTAPNTGATATGCTASVAAGDASCSLCKDGHHRDGDGNCVQSPECNGTNPTGASDACTVGTYSEAPADTYEDGACGTAANSCDGGTADDSPTDSPAVDGACGTAVNACGDGSTLKDIDDTDAEHLWECVGQDGVANWNCAGTAGDWNWSCTSGGSTLDNCTAPGTGSNATGCTSALVADDASCGRCKAGYHRHQGVCVPNPVCAVSEPDCTKGSDEDLPDTPAVDGACQATESAGCAGGSFSDRTDTTLENGECGSTTNSCDGGIWSDRTDDARKELWNCVGIDEAKRWRCAGTDGTSRWQCTSGGQTAQCTAAGASGTDDYCREVVTAATDAEGCFTCIPCADPLRVPNPDSCACVCKNGYHEHNGRCVEDPDCGTVEGTCRPAEATWSEVDDTLVPLRDRWSCAHGDRTKACNTEPPGCRADQLYVLAEGELKCACPDGRHEHNGECVADPACNASPADAADACAPGCYSEPPGDTYEDGRCLAGANQCDHGVEADETPDDVEPKTGVCGEGRNACGHGAEAESVGMTDAEYTWKCPGLAGATKWNCPGTTGEWKWSCTNGGLTIDSCSEPKTGGTAEGCTAPVEAGEVDCSLCRPGYHEHNGRCVEDPDCGTVEGTCRPAEATWSEVDDTLVPLRDRWSCAHGDQTKACNAEPPGCRADQLYVLAEGELKCACPDGRHEHNGECAEDPGCGTVEGTCRPAGATWSEVDDTLVPLRDRWSCAHGDQTKACNAEPPGCRADQLYVLAEGELKCACHDGRHEHNGECAEDPGCGTVEGTCRPAGATWSEVDDTLVPLRDRWSCAHGDQTKACNAEPPGCRADQLYVLAEGELKCACPDGRHEHNGECAENPDCGTVEGTCRPAGATWSEVDDTLVPLRDRWSCAHGDQTKACNAEPPGCRADQLYVLAEGELKCACPDGRHEHNGECAENPDCGTVEGTCRPAGATWSEVDDTLVPLRDRWSCAHGDQTKACNAEPPGCRADQLYVLAEGELKCACPDGRHEHNGECVENPECGTIECVGDCLRWSDDDTGSCSPGTWADVDDTNRHWQGQCTNGGATRPCEWIRPEGNECAAGLVTWTVNSTTCQAGVADTSHLQVLALQDTSMHALSWPTGSATFTCRDGSWVESAGSTCDCDSQCACLSAGGTWVEAQGERARTCTGNNGCAGHTHSCTTPADPDGGFQSCTYKKHKGGLNCTSHSHRTCEPYAPTAAHCHLEIDPDQCPLCFPF